MCDSPDRREHVPFVGGGAREEWRGVRVRMRGSARLCDACGDPHAHEKDAHDMHMREITTHQRNISTMLCKPCASLFPPLASAFYVSRPRETVAASAACTRPDATTDQLQLHRLGHDTHDTGTYTKVGATRRWERREDGACTIACGCVARDRSFQPGESPAQWCMPRAGCMTPSRRQLKRNERCRLGNAALEWRRMRI